MKASILDIRRRMSSILAALDQHESVTLTYRGRDKATIIPTGQKSELQLRTHPAFGIWSDRKDLADVKETVRKLRKGRVNAF